MNKQELLQQIKQKKSYLCVGLDTDIEKIPPHLKSYNDPVFEFNKQIIDATRDVCIAYKPNIAFYEALGSKGWQSLEKTIEYKDSLFYDITAWTMPLAFGLPSAALNASQFKTGLLGDKLTEVPKNNGEVIGSNVNSDYAFLFDWGELYAHGLCTNCKKQVYW